MPQGDSKSGGSLRPQWAPVGALLGATAVSLVGSMLTTVALPWFVLQTTGSAAKTGLTGSFVVLPGFIAGIFGGTLVDRLGYKRVSVAADIVSGCGVALVPLLHHTVGLALWQLLACVFLGALLSVPGLTARRSLVPELAGLAGLRLERVNATLEGIQYLALLLGPPIAGLLIGWLGASNVLWIDAATFAASAAIISTAVPRPAAGGRTAGRYRDDLVAGLRFIRGDRVLFALLLSVAATNLLSNPLFAVLLPVFARDAFGSATDLGLMVAGLGGGSLVGAVVYGTIGHHVPRRTVWIGAHIVARLPFWALTLTESLPLMVGALTVTGIATGSLNPLLVTIRHERIPVNLRGRVFSIFPAVTQAMSAIGIALMGNLIEQLGLRFGALATATCLQVVGIALLFVPALHEMDGQRPVATVPGTPA